MPSSSLDQHSATSVCLRSNSLRASMRLPHCSILGSIVFEFLIVLFLAISCTWRRNSYRIRNLEAMMKQGEEEMERQYQQHMQDMQLLKNQGCALCVSPIAHESDLFCFSYYRSSQQVRTVQRRMSQHNTVPGVKPKPPGCVLVLVPDSSLRIELPLFLSSVLCEAAAVPRLALPTLWASVRQNACICRLSSSLHLAISQVVRERLWLGSVCHSLLVLAHLKHISILSRPVVAQPAKDPNDVAFV
jgi:hypothetical protein